MTTCYKLVAAHCGCIYCEQDRRVARFAKGKQTEADRDHYKRMLIERERAKPKARWFERLWRK